MWKWKWERVKNRGTACTEQHENERVKIFNYPLFNIAQFVEVVHACLVEIKAERTHREIQTRSNEDVLQSRLQGETESETNFGSVIKRLSPLSFGEKKFNCFWKEYINCSVDYGNLSG